MSQLKWKDVILPDYEIRKTKAQKTAFIDRLKEEYGDALTVETVSGGVGSRNLVFGDPETADVIFTAHYDTCAVLPFPNFITPKNFFLYFLYNILICIPMLVLGFGAAWLMSALGDLFSDFLGFLLGEIGLIGMMTLLIVLLIAGPANRHTANDNTSGVVTVLTLLDRFGTDKAAYILFDHEEAGLLGSSGYAKAHPNVKKNGLVVNFDCVSDGDTLLFVFSKDEAEGELRKTLAAMQETAGAWGKTLDLTDTRHAFYPSDQTAFRHSVGVAALKRSKRIGLYMDRIHTPKDTVFDEHNLAALSDLMAAAMSEKQSESV